MRGPRYYIRILQSYFGRGGSNLSFWHETPAVNERAFEDESSQYYMTFADKAEYAGPFDDAGVPMLDYRGHIGKQYNPIAIAQYGLASWNKFHEAGFRFQVSGFRGDKDEADLWFEKALRCADWLVENLEKNDKGLDVWMHHFDWEYFRTLQAPWYSGLAQGNGISLLLRVGQGTGDSRYGEAANRAARVLVTPVSDGGTLFVDEAGDWWIEEYITEPLTHILNGFIWALLSAEDTSKLQVPGFAFQAEMGELWTRGVQTLEKNLGQFDCGYWSMYDLAPLEMKNPASPFYHDLHLVQLDIMHRLTGKDVFNEYLAKWSGYRQDSSSRRKALVHKSIFKLLHY